jgi:hypothetical protein
MIGMSQSLYKQVAQAGADGIAHEQSACEYSDCSGHTEDDGQIRAPVITEIALYEF